MNPELPKSTELFVQTSAAPPTGLPVSSSDGFVVGGNYHLGSSKKWYQTPRFFMSFAGIVILGSAGLLFASQAHHNAQLKLAAAAKAANAKQEIKTAPNTETAQAAASPTPAATQPTASAANESKAKAKIPTTISVTATTSTTPSPAPTPTPPAANTTNCIMSNPSQYDTYFIGMTNSSYLQTNNYIYTTKLYAALQFAGLINTVNTKQYTLLAMSDSAWDALTQKQRDWMNASPANMRSVLGWQIITSCITWHGVNPVQDMAAGLTKTVSTINGSVTFTSRANGGLGTFGSTSVGIWDWFTSNGSVTITGFVKPPQVP